MTILYGFSFHQFSTSLSFSMPFQSKYPRKVSLNKEAKRARERSFHIKGSIQSTHTAPELRTFNLHPSLQKKKRQSDKQIERMPTMKVYFVCSTANNAETCILIIQHARKGEPKAD
jgi:hypothetical protein